MSRVLYQDDQVNVTLFGFDTGQELSEEENTMSTPTTNEPQVQQPNHFELAGDQAQITYDTSGVSGGPLLDYKDGQHRIQELGKNIQAHDSEIGTLVTVMVSDNARSNTRLTLLVPRINLRGDMTETEIHTLAILTTYQTEGSPAVPQTYRALHLRGKASVVKS